MLINAIDATRANPLLSRVSGSSLTQRRNVDHLPCHSKTISFNVEDWPESKDAFDGAIMNCCLALIYARVGENDLVIPLIERLLKTPGAVDSVDYSITLNDLKFRWEWDPLRDDPRFQELIPQHER